MSPTRTAPDLLTSLRNGWTDAMQQWWDQSQAALDPWRQSWEDRSCGCRSSDCRSCDCASPCRCCVPDADVLLHARAGETRVIPFLLSNHWRREREVSLAVGSWQVCGGGRLEVRAIFEAGESLTLQPCEKRVVRLMVKVRGICADGKDSTDTTPTTHTRDTKDGKDTKDGQGGDAQLCDVESCASAYADVRFEGCARPQRVGVVVHPATCDAVALPCDCGCC